MLGLVACAGDPKAALDAYAAAVRAKDAEQIRLLSDEPFRKAYDSGEVEAYLAQHPDAIARLLGAIDGATVVRATIELGDGEQLVLVKEGSAWRVSSGGVEPARADTPEAALATFFRAAEARRLDELRSVMPESFAASFADDAALNAHLSSLAARIEAARNGLPAVRANLAQIEGDRAWIGYGKGKKVELIKEKDRWRVVDLE